MGKPHDIKQNSCCSMVSSHMFLSEECGIYLKIFCQTKYTEPTDCYEPFYTIAEYRRTSFPKVSIWSYMRRARLAMK